MQCKPQKHKLNKMKFRRLFVVFLLLFCSLFFKLSATESHISTLKGVNVSNNIYSFLKKNGYNPLTQSLINNGNNPFPYNIYLNFNKENAQKSNLILIFQQEQLVSNLQLLLDTLTFIQQEELTGNITVLLSYGDKQVIEKQIMIYGTEVFIESINTSEDYTGIFFDLENSKNKILTSSNGSTAPSWLIENEYNIYLKENLSSNLPFYYVSQIYNMKFFYDTNLDILFNNNIPGIKLCLNKSNVENGKAFNIIKESIIKFNTAESHDWEHHFLLLLFFGKYYNLQETLLIRIIIIIIFTWLLFIFLFGFVNISIKKNTWYKIKKIWYSIPLTFLISLISFVAGRIIFNIFINKLSPFTTIYGCLTLQLGLSFLLVTLFYLLFLLLNYNILENSIDYLTVIACFLNQAIFILVDISLIPIYMIIFLLSLLAYFIKNNVINIIVFVLMIAAFFPYGNTIIKNGNPLIIQDYILVNKITPITLSLSIYPIYLVYLRILTSFKNYFKTNKSLILFNLFSYVVVMTILCTFAHVRSSKIKSNYKADKDYKILEISDEKISFNYSDKAIFTDIIRTIEINLLDEPEVCDIRINSLSSNPVLYSDNDYETISKTSVIFKIPENPPEHLEFSYGANKEPCNIIISALYPTNKEKSVYNLVTKVISIGDK